MKFFTTSLLIWATMFTICICKNALCQDISDDVRLVVDQRKNTYKVFEPIEIKVLYINTGDKTDSVYFVMDEIFNEDMQFEIINDEGKVYECFYFSPTRAIFKPPYILLPGDSIISIMNFRCGLSDKNSISPWGGRYLPPGKYNLRANFVKDVIVKRDKPVFSNQLQFEIEELSPEDSLLLHTYKEIKPDMNEKIDIDEKYNEMIALINEFTGNPFNEYIYREILRNRMIKSREVNSEDIYLRAIDEYYKLFPETYLKYKGK